MVQTVRGALKAAELGMTMMHEHIFMQYDERWKTPIFNFVTTELWKLVNLGANTIVDVMPKYERNIRWYQELAELVDINIILSTGFYLENMPEFVTPEQCQWTEEQMYSYMMKELLDGIGGSQVKAGLIKVAGNLPELSPFEKRVLRAAARAQRETGVPICTHACAGARNQFDELVQAGADPQRIYMSHVEAEFGWEGRTLRQQLEYLTEIARQGGSFFFNNFEFQFDTPHEDLMYLMRSLTERGLGHRVLFGMDTNFCVDETGNLYLEAQKEHPETAVRVYSYTLTGAAALLRRWGFTDSDLHTFLVNNPRRMFNTCKN